MNSVVNDSDLNISDQMSDSSAESTSIHQHAKTTARTSLNLSSKQSTSRTRQQNEPTDFESQFLKPDSYWTDRLASQRAQEKERRHKPIKVKHPLSVPVNMTNSATETEQIAWTDGSLVEKNVAQKSEEEEREYKHKLRLIRSRDSMKEIQNLNGDIRSKIEELRRIMQTNKSQ